MHPNGAAQLRRLQQAASGHAEWDLWRFREEDWSFAWENQSGSFGR